MIVVGDVGVRDTVGEVVVADQGGTAADAAAAAATLAVDARRRRRLETCRVRAVNAGDGERWRWRRDGRLVPG